MVKQVIYQTIVKTEIRNKEDDDEEEESMNEWKKNKQIIYRLSNKQKFNHSINVFSYFSATPVNCEPSYMENGFSTIRKSVGGLITQYKFVADKVTDTVETGIAHSECKIAFLFKIEWKNSEDNIIFSSIL